MEILQDSQPCEHWGVKCTVGPEAPRQVTVFKGHFQGGGRGHTEQEDSQGAQGQMTVLSCPG